MCVYPCTCTGRRARVCAAPASPARGPRSPFTVSRPPNYLPLRSELNESRRVTSLSAVSPFPRRPTATADVSGMVGRQGWSVKERERQRKREAIDGKEKERRSWPSFIRLFSLPEMAEFNPELGLASSPQITP